MDTETKEERRRRLARESRGRAKERAHLARLRAESLEKPCEASPPDIDPELVGARREAGWRVEAHGASEQHPEMFVTSRWTSAHVNNRLEQGDYGSQGGTPLHSARLSALRHMRFLVLEQTRDRLAYLDLCIEQEEANPTPRPVAPRPSWERK